MSMTTITAEIARRELGATFAGDLVGPSDAGYDAARAVYNAMVDRRPAVIARCSSPNDVAAAIGFATRHDLLLAVRGGRLRRVRPGEVDDHAVVADAEAARGGGGRRGPHGARRRRLHAEHPR